MTSSVERREYCFNGVSTLFADIVCDYNRSCAWQDIQYVMDAHACVMYIASYIMKHEKSMGELLNNVAKEVRDEDLSLSCVR